MEAALVKYRPASVACAPLPPFPATNAFVRRVCVSRSAAHTRSSDSGDASLRRARVSSKNLVKNVMFGLVVQSGVVRRTKLNYGFRGCEIGERSRGHLENFFSPSLDTTEDN